MRNEDGSHPEGEVGGEDRSPCEGEVSVEERCRTEGAGPSVFSAGHPLIGAAGDSLAASEVGEPVPGGAAGDSLTVGAHENPSDKSREGPRTTASTSPLPRDALKNPQTTPDESPSKKSSESPRTTASASPLPRDALKIPQTIADERPCTSSGPESPRASSAAEIPHPMSAASPLTTPPFPVSIPRDPESFGDTDLVDLLKRLSADDDRLVDLREIPGRRARVGDWPSWVASDVVEAWRAQGAKEPWSHQVSALDAIHSGSDVVLASGTGSGKSVAAWTPILSDLCQVEDSARISAIRRRPTCLYLSPTKALAADQLAGLTHLLTACAQDSPLSTVRAMSADGDTPREAKEWARANADILLSNPDFLHYVMLASHQRWTRFLASLKYIVIDELHHWRGVLGAHVSLVIRRLLRIAHSLGANPIIIMLSATIRDPASVAEAMTGRGAEAIDEDGSPCGSHHLALWQGRLIPEESEVDISEFLRVINGEDVVLEAPMRRISAQSEAANLGAAFMEEGARLLLFCRSRAGAESLAAQVKDRLAAHGSALAGQVAAYRGGYLPEERRALERGLRSGKLRALATTSALELGLDVSALDATVTVGWPGTRASLRQQMGRAGRAGAPGVSVLIASENPLDAYLLHHPEEILAPVETVVIDPFNPYVLAPHLCAAAGELPLSESRTQGEDLALFGPGMTALAERLAAEGYLRRRPAGWYWDATRKERASDLTDLRGSSGEVQIVDARSGALIGTIDEASADAHVFPDAVYIHQGRTFHVLSLFSMMAPLSHEAGAGVGASVGAGAGVGAWAGVESEAEVGVGAGTSARAEPNAGAGVGTWVGAVDEVDIESRVRVGSRADIWRESGARAKAWGAPSLIPASSRGAQRQRIAVVEEVRTPLRTRAKQHVSVSVRQVERSWTSEDGLVTWRFGAVDVTSRVTDYDLLRLPGLEFIRNCELRLPTRVLETKAVWYELSAHALAVLGLGRDELPGTLHAAEHAAIGILPLFAACDRWDLGGLSTAEHEDTGLPSVFVHDAFRGGAGHAETGFERAGSWMRATLDTLLGCECEEGCPRCVQSPKCGNGNEPLSKAGAILLLNFLVDHCPPG